MTDVAAECGFAHLSGPRNHLPVGWLPAQCWGAQLCRAWSQPSDRARSPHCKALREGLEAPLVGACPGHCTSPGTQVTAGDSRESRLLQGS